MKRDGARKGRGATVSPDNRYLGTSTEKVDDGWQHEEDLPLLKTQITLEQAKTIISYNQSPDVPFDRSLNPYRGCEHGCVYCFARPSHAYMDLSPGLDFEAKLFSKPNAAEILKKELDKDSYQCQSLALGINTDAYQPIEREQKITRQCLEVFRDYKHPVGLITKSALVERDIDIFQEMARDQLIHVMVSITTLDKQLARTMEPRAAAPQRRLEIIRRLSAAGIPVGVMVAPIIPVLTDSEMETILEQAREAGAQQAGFVVLRMPHEIKGLFSDWLATHYPLKVEHVLNRMRDLHGDNMYQANFGQRMRGTGEFSELLRQRFRLAYKRLGFVSLPELNVKKFKSPNKPEQMPLL